MTAPQLPWKEISERGDDILQKKTIHLPYPFALRTIHQGERTGWFCYHEHRWEKGLWLMQGPQGDLPALCKGCWHLVSSRWTSKSVVVNIDTSDVGRMLRSVMCSWDWTPSPTPRTHTVVFWEVLPHLCTGLARQVELRGLYQGQL